jgi:hypothetical protein
MTEWTIPTLKEYVDSKFESSKEAVNAALASAEKAIAAAMAAAEKATTKAETAAEKRFEGLNEWRGAMTDLQSGMANKEATDLRFKVIEQRLAEQGGQSRGQELIWKLIAAASAAAVIASFVIGRL